MPNAWTVAGGKDYAGKPRPMVIVQGDHFNATNAVTVCGFTRDQTDASLFRLPGREITGRGFWPSASGHSTDRAARALAAVADQGKASRQTA
jgi:mRNA-degrading endonuclease toxin of MazEF toxin-antitoxin module